MRTTLQITGLQEVLREIRSFGDEASRMASATVQASGDNVVLEAKQKAPGDMGKLKQSISKTSKNRGLVAKISANVVYAPYVEFGTGVQVKVPAGYQELASKYKGIKTGTFDEFILAIAEWCKRKGIVPKASNGEAAFEADIYDYDNMYFMIAFAILKKGLKPRPFLIPAFEAERHRLRTNLEIVLNRLISQTNRR